MNLALEFLEDFQAVPGYSYLPAAFPAQSALDAQAATVKMCKSLLVMTNPLKSTSNLLAL